MPIITRKQKKSRNHSPVLELTGMPHAAFYQIRPKAIGLIAEKLGYMPTQKELADLTGLSIMTINRLVNGAITQIGTETIYRLCAVLGTNRIDDIIAIDSNSIDILVREDVYERLVKFGLAEPVGDLNY